MDLLSSFRYSFISGKLKLVGRGYKGVQQENKGAGCEASNCFMPLDVNKTIPVPNTLAARTFGAGTITVMQVINVFTQVVVVALNYNFARCPVWV